MRLGLEDSCNRQETLLKTTSILYLDIVGKLRCHQIVEFLFAQGAGGSIFASICLKLGDKGADCVFHDGFCWGVTWKSQLEEKIHSGN